MIQVAQLTEAMQLVEEHGRRVNEKVRASENARRLLKIRDSLMKEGKKEFDLDITADPERNLIFEGKLQHIAIGGGGKPTLTEIYVILLSDMMLITTERDGKYVIRPGKEPTPVILLDAIHDVKAEMKSASERIRTTLCKNLILSSSSSSSSSSSFSSTTPSSVFATPTLRAHMHTPHQSLCAREWGRVAFILLCW